MLIDPDGRVVRDGYASHLDEMLAAAGWQRPVRADHEESDDDG